MGPVGGGGPVRTHLDAFFNIVYCNMFIHGRVNTWSGLDRTERAGLPPAGSAGAGEIFGLEDGRAGIQLEHRVDAAALVKSPDLLCIFLDGFQDRVAGLGPLVHQGKADTVQPVFWLVGEDIRPEPRRLQGAGHAPHPREHVRPADGTQGEQARQGVPGHSK